MSIFRIFTLFSLIAFLSCSESTNNSTDSDGDGKPSAEMIGSWIFTSVTVDGNPVNLSIEMEWVAGAVEARLHVYENSAYAYEQVDTKGGQLWAESGFVFVDESENEIDINVQQINGSSVTETVYVTYTLIGNTLTLTEIDEGTTIVFTLIKSV